MPCGMRKLEKNKRGRRTAIMLTKAASTRTVPPSRTAVVVKKKAPHRTVATVAARRRAVEPVPRDDPERLLSHLSRLSNTPLYKYFGRPLQVS